jgi:hypothetical protein
MIAARRGPSLCVLSAKHRPPGNAQAPLRLHSPNVHLSLNQRPQRYAYPLC